MEMDKLHEKVMQAIEAAYKEDTGRGVGFAPVAATAILAIPEIKEALETKKRVRGAFDAELRNMPSV